MLVLSPAPTLSCGGGGCFATPYIDIDIQSAKGADKQENNPFPPSFSPLYRPAEPDLCSNLLRAAKYVEGVGILPGSQVICLLTDNVGDFPYNLPLPHIHRIATGTKADLDLFHILAKNAQRP